MADDEEYEEYELDDEDNLFIVFNMLDYSEDGDVFLRHDILENFFDDKGMIADEYLDIIDNDGNTPLHILCKISNLTIDANTLKLFFKDGIINVNHKNIYGNTALHEIATRYCDEDNGFRHLNDFGIYDITMCLLKYGADLHIQNKNHITPFEMFQDCSNYAINKSPYRSKLFHNIVDIDSSLIKEPDL
jgi:hypothetical protein